MHPFNLTQAHRPCSVYRYHFAHGICTTMSRYSEMYFFLHWGRCLCEFHFHARHWAFCPGLSQVQQFTVFSLSQPTAVHELLSKVSRRPKNGAGALHLYSLDSWYTHQWRLPPQWTAFSLQTLSVLDSKAFHILTILHLRSLKAFQPLL